jgi:multiple sugar transport system substrate-binding protein
LGSKLRSAVKEAFVRRHLAVVPLMALAAAAACVAGCGGSDKSGSAANGSGAHGPITVWMSPLTTEVDWGKQMASQWNAKHPKETVKVVAGGQGDDAATLAAISAGKTPCLGFNSAQTVIGGHLRAGGVVPLSDFPDGNRYIEARSGSVASQYKSQDGKYYQLPWKENPAMLYFNKSMFAKAGLKTDGSDLKTYDQFLAAAKAIVSKGAVKAAVWPPPTADWYNAWFDFYSFYVAQSGKPLIENGQPTFTSPEALDVARLWRQVYAAKLAPAEAYGGTDPFADGKSAMAVWGSDLLPVYEKQKVPFGVVSIPTQSGKPADQTDSFINAKTIEMFTNCKNRGTAWDFLKFVTSTAGDRQLLQDTLQLPIRQGLESQYSSFFAQHPELKPFAQQSQHVVDSPALGKPVDVQMWTDLRKAWVDSVIFGRQPIPDAFHQAADQVKQLLGT